jgi:hypothetical protein
MHTGAQTGVNSLPSPLSPGLLTRLCFSVGHGHGHSKRGLRPWRGEGAGTLPGELGSGHGAGELGPEEGSRGHGHDKGGLRPWRGEGTGMPPGELGPEEDGHGKDGLRPWRGEGTGTPPGELGSGHGACELPERAPMATAKSATKIPIKETTTADVVVVDSPTPLAPRWVVTPQAQLTTAIMAPNT